MAHGAFACLIEWSQPRPNYLLYPLHSTLLYSTPLWPSATAASLGKGKILNAMLGHRPLQCGAVASYFNRQRRVSALNDTDVRLGRSLWVVVGERQKRKEKKRKEKRKQQGLAGQPQSRAGRGLVIEYRPKVTKSLWKSKQGKKREKKQTRR